MKIQSLALNFSVLLVASIIGMLFRNYEEVSPLVGFAIGIMFGFCSILFSARYAATKSKIFKMPSLLRLSTFDWWRDPLQFYVIWTLFIAGISLGSMTYLAWGVFSGVIAAQLLVFRLYRDRIQRAEQGAAANP